MQRATSHPLRRGVLSFWAASALTLAAVAQAAPDAGACAHGPREGALTLAAAAEQALCQNAPLHAMRRGVAAEEGQIETARAAYWPSVGLAFNVSHMTMSGSTLQVDTGNGTSMVAVTNGVRTTNATVSLQANYTLWDFGVRAANLQRALLQQEAAQAALSASQQALLAQVVTSYFALLSASADSSAPTSATRQAQAQLANLLGLPPDTALHVERPAVLAFETPAAWQDWWQLAKLRPDLLAARRRTQAEQENVKAARAARWGAVSLNWTASPGYSSVTQRSDTQSVGIAYAVPLLNGPTPSQASAQAQVAAREADEEAALQQAQLEVYRAWDTYREAYLKEAAATQGSPGAALTDESLAALVQARVGLLQAVGQLTVETLTAVPAAH